MRRNNLVKVGEIWRNRPAEAESGYDPRRKKKGCFAKTLKLKKTYRSWDDWMLWVGPVPVSWKKNEELEMIKCFELALWQSRETKRRSNTLEILYLPLCVYISCCSTHSFSPLFRKFRNKRKRKEADYIFRIGIVVVVLPSIQH